MGDAGLSNLLKWSIENTNNPSTDDNATDASSPQKPRTNLDNEALRALMGGPSQADLMISNMTTISSPSASLENKLTAWDNFEQLIENLDNANNMTNLGLWDPLIMRLQDREADVRLMAAWCVGTAVQNNVKAQVQLLATGAIKSLVDLSLRDEDLKVRKKAARAVSSLVRNYQPALDEVKKYLPSGIKEQFIDLEASDMEGIDNLVDKMKDYTK